MKCIYRSYSFLGIVYLCCKLLPSDKFPQIQLYFFYEIAYNGVSDKKIKNFIAGDNADKALETVQEIYRQFANMQQQDKWREEEI